MTSQEVLLLCSCLGHQCEYSLQNPKIQPRIKHHMGCETDLILCHIGEQYNIQEGDRKEKYRELFGVTIYDSALQLSSLHVLWVPSHQQRVG